MKDYKKYKWFYTSKGNLIVGGKSAKQNDELLEKIKKSGKEYYIMHTSSPGSPFCVILSDVNKVGKKDLEECAVFTGCFSRAWKTGKKKAEVHIFKASQVEKKKGMKTGTWGVHGKVQKVNVELKLALVKQKKVYKAVPEKSAKKKDEAILRICPGKTAKAKIVNEILLKVKAKKEKKNELLSALPAGGSRVC